MPSKNIFKKKKKKTTEAERNHNQQTHTAGNVIVSPLDRRKIISDGNMDLHEGMKRYIRFVSFKLLKKKKTTDS